MSGTSGDHSAEVTCPERHVACHRAKAVGLAPDRYDGYSLRACFGPSAAAGGPSEPAIIPCLDASFQSDVGSDAHRVRDG